MSTGALLSTLVAAAVLAVLAAVCRRLPLGGRAWGWPGWADVPLAVGCGIATALVGAWFLAPASLDRKSVV